MQEAGGEAEDEDEDEDANAADDHNDDEDAHWCTAFAWLPASNLRCRAFWVH